MSTADLAAFAAAGPEIRISRADPGMFHTDLNTEYRLCRDMSGMDVAELAEISWSSVRAAFCSGELRSRILTEIDHVIAG
jgi:aminodeoxyfutalosine deaminase